MPRQFSHRNILATGVSTANGCQGRGVFAYECNSLHHTPPICLYQPRLFGLAMRKKQPGTTVQPLLGIEAEAEWEHIRASATAAAGKLLFRTRCQIRSRSSGILGKSP